MDKDTWRIAQTRDPFGPEHGDLGAARSSLLKYMLGVELVIGGYRSSSEAEHADPLEGIIWCIFGDRGACL